MSTGSEPQNTPHNLPLQSTSFIGREAEIAAVTRQLNVTRLLTLTGAGGCGKTRLALQAAAGVLAAHPDGVWLSELAALADPGLLPQAVAVAVGLPEAVGSSVTDRLVHYLRTRSLLLVLDNCEHLVEAAARLVATLLRSCAGLRVLATSREALGCDGETTWRVPSLLVPPESAAAEAVIEQVTEYEAVRLFIDRASATLPSFTVTDRNAPALAEICRRLDGIPLAIELAAVRIGVFSVQQIAARLNDRFHLLTTGQRTALPRQQTLLATVDWSYNLLSEPERALLRRLSVFAGGWTFEAAESVGAGDGIEAYALLDLLAQLVEKSLVLAEQQRGAVRYRLLETIRQYAREKLREAGEEVRTQDRHLAYFLGLAEVFEPKLRGAEDRATLQQLEEEHDNLRVALEWALTPARGGEDALRLTGALTWFWWLRSYHDEGSRWLARALAGTSDRSAARMKALHGAGWLAHHRRDSAMARERLSESLGIARELQDGWMVAWALHALGRVAYYDNDPTSAHAFGEESLAIAEDVGDGWLVAYALHLLGLAAHIASDYPTARTYYARSLAIRQQLGYQEGIIIMLVLLGVVAVREGDLGRAHALYREALPVVQSVLGRWALGMPLACFCHLAAAQGQAVRAVRLGAAATALREAYHTPLIPLVEPLLAQGLEQARHGLDEAAYAAAWDAGYAMSPEEGVAEALAVELRLAVIPLDTAPDARGDKLLASLTTAEMQVLQLLAGGRTTREIAGVLVLAISTVDRHLTHIYQKLGVRNRVEATARAVKGGLT